MLGFTDTLAYKYFTFYKLLVPSLYVFPIFLKFFCQLFVKTDIVAFLKNNILDQTTQLYKLLKTLLLFRKNIFQPEKSIKIIAFTQKSFMQHYLLIHTHRSFTSSFFVIEFFEKSQN